MEDEKALLLTETKYEHSCTVHSMGERLGSERCLACAFEEGAKALPIIEKQSIRKLGRRLKSIREDSYDQATFDYDLRDCIDYALRGEVLPMPKIVCLGTVFKNPFFNPEYAKPHAYEHSIGYPKEPICVCGKRESDPIHKAPKGVPDED